MVFFSIVSAFLAFAEKGDNSIVAKRDVSVNQPCLQTKKGAFYVYQNHARRQYSLFVLWTLFSQSILIGDWWPDLQAPKSFKLTVSLRAHWGDCRAHSAFIVAGARLPASDSRRPDPRCMVIRACGRSVFSHRPEAKNVMIQSMFSAVSKGGQYGINGDIRMHYLCRGSHNGPRPCNKRRGRRCLVGLRRSDPGHPGSQGFYPARTPWFLIK